jgi:hypothetical protein
MSKLLIAGLIAAGLAIPAVPAFAQADNTAPAAMSDHAAPAKHKKAIHKKVPHKTVAPAPKAE